MKNCVVITLLLLSVSAFSQKNRVIANQYTHFQLEYKKDTIDFVVADAKLEKIKPVLLFCQGSQPVPLFIDMGERGVFPVTLNNFDLEEMKRNYHVVVVSMPKTPVLVAPKNLNRSYNYVLDTANQYSYSPEYLEADYLENYVDRANKVIKFLRKQKWVDKTKLIVSGHSQGSRVAVGIAASNKNVSGLGLFGYNPMRRVDQLVWSYRKQAQYGEITWEEADSLQQEQYQFYKTVLDEDSLSANPNLRSWKSFSTSSISQLVNLKIPVYIANGSQDNVAEYCDLLPLYFAEKDKIDYQIKRYPGLEHNFFPIDENGKRDYSNGQWKKVMNSFIEWSLTKPHLRSNG